MKTVTLKDQYSGFDQPIHSIAKFISAGDLFTIMLKNGKIIHYTSQNAEAFKQWLVDNDIQDIKMDLKILNSL